MPIHSRGYNYSPNAHQANWCALLRELGSAVSGNRSPFVEAHHPIGATAEIKGVGNIGQYFVVILSHDEHELIAKDLQKFKELVYQYNRSEVSRWHEAVWDMTRLELEKMLFFQQIQRLIMRGHALEISCPGDVMLEIARYHR